MSSRDPTTTKFCSFLFFFFDVRLWSLSLSHSVSFYLLRVSLSMGLTSSLSLFTFGLLVLLLPFLSIVICRLHYLINSLKVTHPTLHCLAFVSCIATTISHCFFFFMFCYIIYVLHSISVSVLSSALHLSLFVLLFALRLLLSYTIRHDLFTLSPNQQ